MSMPIELAFSQKTFFSTTMRVCARTLVCVKQKDRQYRMLYMVFRRILFHFCSFPNEISKYQNASQFPANLNRALCACVRTKATGEQRKKKQHQQHTNDKIKLDIMLKSILFFSSFATFTRILCA